MRPHLSPIRLAGLALAVTMGCSPSAASPDGAATIVEVVDGDTVVVDLGSGEETVRLLGVDTPETKHPTEPIECFGPEASAFTAGLLPPGTRVTLERDIEARDTFGRLLAYVRRADDGLFVNLELVRQGFADVLVIAPNEAYADVLRAATQVARSDGTGLWSACGGPDTPADRSADASGEAVPSAP